MDDELKRELEYVKGSREFQLGVRLRQSWLLKRIRRMRFKDRQVTVRVVGENGGTGKGVGRVCLLGVYSEEYPLGMPLEFLERDMASWRLVEMPGSPYRAALVTQRAGDFTVYSNNQLLKLDFRLDNEGGKIEVEARGIRKTFDLRAERTKIISVYPNRGEIEASVKGDDADLDREAEERVAPYLQKGGLDFSEAHIHWIEQQQIQPRPLSINHPEWRGILAASQQLYENIYTIPDDLDWERGVYFAHLIVESRAPSVTIQGFPLTYVHLVKALRKLAPKLPIYAIYHGNYLHVREDYDWECLKTIKTLHDAGDIDRVGFVKKGMAEIMASAGMRSAFIMNLVRRVPDAPSIPLHGGRHIGVWGQPDWSWKKPPYAMLAAMKLIPEGKAHVYNVSPRAQEFGKFLGVRAEYNLGGVPQSQVPQTMAQMHLNLYVTLTECAPMMPLESLSMGSPCLLGPNSPYFLDNDYLFSRLVVPFPEQADWIARFANQALDERDEIIRTYQGYAPGYNQLALKTLADFLESSPGRK